VGAGHGLGPLLAAAAAINTTTSQIDQDHGG
jgi:hypothetical protein